MQRKRLFIGRIWPRTGSFQFEKLTRSGVFLKKLVRAALLVLLAGWLAGAVASEGTNRFGFSGPEIFPIDNQIAHLRAADLDGDGLQDLIVVNNARSKITLLYNQTGRPRSEAPASVKRDLNELPIDARFRLDSIASEKRISSLVVTDLNGDGKPDIAYYGEPKELVVQYNQGTNGWSPAKRFALEDGLLDPYALVAGDLNGDKRVDLCLLAENYIYFLAQSAEGTMAEPEKIPYSGSVKSIQILDIQGDGRDDLLLVNWDNVNPFRFRLQSPAGQLGPEIHFTLPPIRSYMAEDLDGDHKTEVITIAQKSGRAQSSVFAQKPAEELLGAWRQGQFQVMPLTKTSKAKRGAAWADINGDGRVDLLIAEPESGQLTLHLQAADGTLEASKTFATLTGITELSVTDWNADKAPEIFLLSADERQIGVTQFDKNGRIPFPRILPVEGRPLAMTVGKLAGGRASLAMIVDLDGKRELQIRESDGAVRKQKLSENFKSNPTSMTIHDVDQDGQPDIVILIPYEKIKVLLQTADKGFAEEDISPPGGSAEQPWLSTADVDGDGKAELLLAQRNFLRAVVLQREGTNDAGAKTGWAFMVKEQINGVASNSRIVGMAPMPKPDQKIPALFLLDAERKSLTLSDRDASGVWHVVRNLPIPVSEFSSIQAVGFGDTVPNAVTFSGVNAVAWMSLKGQVWEFQERDGYETPIKDGFLHDVVAGDLNQDGRKDLVFLETSKSYLDLVTFEKPHNLVPANRWQVFEERTFRNRRSDVPEPREAMVIDVTGDGKNDLVLIVHDRILVYPQED